MFYIEWWDTAGNRWETRPWFEPDSARREIYRSANLHNVTFSRGTIIPC